MRLRARETAAGGGVPPHPGCGGVRRHPVHADGLVRQLVSWGAATHAEHRPRDCAGAGATARARHPAVAKLEWAKPGESARQVEDAAGILRARSAELDASYLERWVRELGIEREWAAARRASVR